MVILVNLVKNSSLISKCRVSKKSHHALTKSHTKPKKHPYVSHTKAIISLILYLNIYNANVFYQIESNDINIILSDTKLKFFQYFNLPYHMIISEKIDKL